MQKGVVKKFKLFITLAIVVAFLWFLVVSPMITFRSNEKKMEDAAKRYFELNSRELPTGERIKTVGLNTLYHKAFIEGDLYIPYTHKTCSIENSWVKVKKVNNEYKWEKIGSTKIDLSGLGDLAWKNSASGSYTPSGEVS